MQRHTLETTFFTYDAICSAPESWITRHEAYALPADDPLFEYTVAHNLTGQKKVAFALTTYVEEVIRAYATHEKSPATRR